jgi:hypothetical protein
METIAYRIYRLERFISLVMMAGLGYIAGDMAQGWSLAAGLVVAGCAAVKLVLLTVYRRHRLM